MMPVYVKDNTRAFLGRFDDARRKGVTAAANLLLRELKHNFGSDYYLGGKYRETIGVKKSLRRSTTMRGAEGYEARVGSKHIVALYWELGWRHWRSGKMYRKEIFRPTMVDNMQAIREEFAQTVKRYGGA